MKEANMVENRRSEHFQRMLEFEKAVYEKMGKHFVFPSSPTYPPKDVLLLRAKLILEEALEVIEALGFKPVIKENNIDFVSTVPKPIGEAAKELADLIVVTTGTMIHLGIEDEAVLRIVDENNMTKFGEGAYFRSDGKLMKPPQYKKLTGDEILNRVKGHD